MTEPVFLFDPKTDNVPVNGDGLNAGWTITLPAAVKRHALGSMRLAEGDRLTLSDGCGLAVHATVSDVQAGLVSVDSVGRTPQPVTRLALIQALAKNGHDETAIDMATQIGVDEVIPWQANRSIAKWKAGRTDRKWMQVLEAATEQSRRVWTPQLGECVSSKQVTAICRRACVHGDLVIVLHQDATATWSSVEESIATMVDRCLADGKPRTVSVVVGPEGGIAEEEVDMFVQAGAASVVLGENILRASCAGPVALSLLARALGRFR
ncbi:16S rRNA (uracil(1498)-N(3))-methyltransferase [Bifidobacterium leontopitheci]|uniref:Ribosomal RNA small subunit methyltransferase E n=1 Tax=Bifidobacterium leontopitheci TaxID=2650774 RepID=A0A6I1GKF6_9BIFI|nr:16S rRNA (uracil(1498)-N(3))-methyltransferase [Bifidobacterium leontopitheci]KAB7791252.1 16S rRNA methyltransferase [Bifidobacterium leontopitheci]